MKLNIGNTIKNLRKEKDITQDELADILGVSYQSVSRWETGICYPDMELIPILADFFGVTVDMLFGINETMKEQKIEEYLLSFQEAISKGKVYECIAIAREAVAEYPNNYALLNKLMYALFLAGDDDGNIPDWKENREKYDAEITVLGERIMKYCPDPTIRLEATARLAFNHCEMGRKEIGSTIYETLPSAEFCKENQMWWSLADNEKLPFLRNKIKKDYEALKSSIWRLEASGCIADEEAILAIQKIWELEKIIYDSEVTPNAWGAARLQVDTAKLYAKLGDNKEAIQHLAIGAKAAKVFDERPEEQVFSNMLLGNITVKKLDYETADTRTLCEILRDKWLSAPEFDRLRSMDEFRDILDILS